ncbi:MAG TPA: hypothetical protein VIG42_09660 [Solirubrobacteraceae bacterium]
MQGGGTSTSRCHAPADGLLSEHLSASPVDFAELAQTLDRAAKLRATLPASDEAVLLVGEGRDELPERFERR